MLPPPLRRPLVAGIGLTITGGSAVAMWRRGCDVGGSAACTETPPPDNLFVARYEEVRALRVLTATTGWGPVWLLRGDRGVGKTRLMREHAEHERLQGRIVVELSLRDDKLHSAQLAATLTHGLGLARAASFEGISAQLDEKWRSAGHGIDGDKSTVPMLPLIIADDVPVDSAGVCTTETSAALAEWAYGAAAAGQARVVLVARESLPTYRVNRPSSGKRNSSLCQTRTLWLNWLPVEDSRELARSLSAQCQDDRNRDNQDCDDVAAQERTHPTPASQKEIEEVHMASASGCPGEMIELLSAGLAGARTCTSETAEERQALEPKESGAIDSGQFDVNSGIQQTFESVRCSAVDRAIAKREVVLLKLMGLPPPPPHAKSLADLIELLSTVSDGTTSTAACWAVASWELFAKLAGLTPDGSTAEILGSGPQELLQQWNASGEGEPGFRRGGQMLWGEVCVALLSGQLGMEVLVRQRLGVPVPSDDSDRAAVAEACAQFVQSGVLGLQPNTPSSKDWGGAVLAAEVGVEVSDITCMGRIGDGDWDVVMGSLTREAVVRLHRELQAAREAALPVGGFARSHCTTDSGIVAIDHCSWADGLRPEMAMIATLQLRQLVEVDEWERTVDEMTWEVDRDEFARAQVELHKLTTLPGKEAQQAALRLLVDLDSARLRVRV